MPSTIKLFLYRWGIKNEHKAIEKLKKNLLAEGLHPGFRIRECGLVVSSQHPFLAASPDRIMSCNCHGDMTIEVKCPFKHRSSTLQQAVLEDNDFCLELDPGGLFQLTKNHPYYFQVQLQMYVTGNTESCLFCVYLENDFACVEVPFDIDLVRDEIIPKSKLFIINVVLPELLSRYWTQMRF